MSLFPALSPLPDQSQVRLFEFAPVGVVLPVLPHLTHAIVRCRVCDAAGTVTLSNGGCAPVACPVCATRMDVVPIRATHSDAPCDARCTGAVGPDCSCSCGGQNHGRSHVRL